jgi:putative membrane protein
MWHWGDPAGWWAMVLWMALLLAAVVVIIWLLVRAGRERGPQPPGESAEEILRRRFAAGEIDAEEYERRIAVLARRRTPGSD